jgi:hypothetical protein
MNSTCLLQINLSGFINYNTFSVVSSIINENAKMRCSIVTCVGVPYHLSYEGLYSQHFIFFSTFEWAQQARGRHDIQHNDTQHNGTRYLARYC